MPATSGARPSRYPFRVGEVGLREVIPRRYRAPTPTTRHGASSGPSSASSQCSSNVASRSREPDDHGGGVAVLDVSRPPSASMATVIRGGAWRLASRLFDRHRPHTRRAHHWTRASTRVPWRVQQPMEWPGATRPPAGRGIALIGAASRGRAADGGLQHVRHKARVGERQVQRLRARAAREAKAAASAAGRRPGGRRPAAARQAPRRAARCRSTATPRAPR